MYPFTVFGEGFRSRHCISSANDVHRRPGCWQPLPNIRSGIVIHPYRPATTPDITPTNPQSTGESSKTAAQRNRFSWSGVQGDNGRKRGKTNAYEIPLDVGDEFFAFEEYRCTVEEDGRGDVWFRG